MVTQKAPVLSQHEKNAMLIITGITNFACLPAIYLMYQKKLYYQFYLGLFTFITSFMYHSMESVDWNKVYLDRGTWHKLDNIGSICCFQSLFVYFMDNLHYKKGKYYSRHVSDTDMQLNMVSLLITLLMQAHHPWLLENTIIPILIFVFLFLVSMLLGRRPRFNLYFLKRGLGMLAIAVCCFIKGLDEFSDYLRIYHGLWHCFIGFGSFFLWQAIDKDRQDARQIYKFESQPRFAFFRVLFNILTFRSYHYEEIDLHKRL